MGNVLNLLMPNIAKNSEIVLKIALKKQQSCKKL